MTLNFYISESNVYPTLIDTESSNTTVYIRRNIEELSIEDETGESDTIFRYEEAKLPKSDYAIYLAELNNANIDYISMMTGVDIE